MRVSRGGAWILQWRRMELLRLTAQRRQEQELSGEPSLIS